MDPDDAGAASDVVTLVRLLNSTWDRFQAGQFGRVAAILPSLIGECRGSVLAGETAAASPLAQAYQIAARLMVYMGQYDLAAIATERALTAAGRGDDELLWANLHATFCWMLLNAGRFAEAESHAVRIAGQIEPTISKASADHVAVWGGLLLKALAAAAAGSRDREARESTSPSLTRGQAASTPTALSTAGCSSGRRRWPCRRPTPTPCSAARPTPYAPLTAFSATSSSRCPTVATSWTWLDTRSQDVVATLQRAQQVSPEWFRHQAIARATVAEMVTQHRRLTPEVRALARAAEFE
jgi:hypothetical protein